MVNEQKTIRDEQTFQKEIVLNRLSSITLQQAHRNVIHVESTNKHTIEKTLKETTDMFIQNLNKICKTDVKDKKVSNIIVIHE